MLGEPFRMGEENDEPVEEPDVESYEFAESFVAIIANRLIVAGKVNTHPPRVEVGVSRDGLKGIPEAKSVSRSSFIESPTRHRSVYQSPYCTSI